MEFEISAQEKTLNSEIFFAQTGCHLYTRDGILYIYGCQSKNEAEALIAAHNSTPPAEPTVADKLASVGLNLDNLKIAHQM